LARAPVPRGEAVRRLAGMAIRCERRQAAGVAGADSYLAFPLSIPFLIGEPPAPFAAASGRTPVEDIYFLS
jgi:hypothetical protein